MSQSPEHGLVRYRVKSMSCMGVVSGMRHAVGQRHNGRNQKGENMTPAQARKDATKVLSEAGITYRALKSRTVSFEDLARASMIFVEVYGVQCTAGQWDTVDGKHDGYILKARS